MFLIGFLSSSAFSPQDPSFSKSKYDQSVHAFSQGKCPTSEHWCPSPPSSSQTYLSPHPPCSHSVRLSATWKVSNIHFLCSFSPFPWIFLRYPSSTSQPGKFIFQDWIQFKFTITMKIFLDLSRYTYSTPSSRSPATTHAACRLIYFCLQQTMIYLQVRYLCMHTFIHPSITFF